MDKKLDKIIDLLEEIKKLQHGRKCQNCGHTQSNSDISSFCHNCDDDLDRQ